MLPKMQATEFSFRIWLHPELGDPPEVEVWYQGIEPTDGKRGFVSDWVHESMQNEDFWCLFDFDGSDKDKHWQIVGKGSLKGWFDFFGDYDEECYIIEFEKVEVPESYWDSRYPEGEERCQS